MTTPITPGRLWRTLTVLSLDPIRKRRKENHLTEGKPELLRGCKASLKMCGNLVKLALATFARKLKLDIVHRIWLVCNLFSKRHVNLIPPYRKCPAGNARKDPDKTLCSPD